MDAGLAIEYITGGGGASVAWHCPRGVWPCIDPAVCGLALTPLCVALHLPPVCGFAFTPLCVALHLPRCVLPCIDPAVSGLALTPM